MTAGWRPGGPTAGPQADILDRWRGGRSHSGQRSRGRADDGRGEVVASGPRTHRARDGRALMAVVAPGRRSSRATTSFACAARAPRGVETVSVPVTLPAASTASGAVFIRRGPSTGNKDMPTADLRFRRSERIRVEVPSAAARHRRAAARPHGEAAAGAGRRRDANRRRRLALGDGRARSGAAGARRLC